MIVPRCPICGAEHVNCGGPSDSVPVDGNIREVAPVAKLKRVEVRPGVFLKLTEDEAKQYETEPETKAVEEPPEDKQVRKSANKSRKKSSE